jgi:hypothetical protein
MAFFVWLVPSLLATSFFTVLGAQLMIGGAFYVALLFTVQRSWITGLFLLGLTDRANLRPHN